MRTPLAALALLLLPLSSGCTGTMLIWGVNTGVDSTGDDDDDLPAKFDFSTYEGVEYVNIDWAQQFEQQGRDDCSAPWSVSGTETTSDDQNLCPSCDHIWLLEMTPGAGVESCYANTNFSTEPRERRVGIELIDDVNFRMWRNSQDSDNPLDEVGDGAFLGTEFTWSGSETQRESVGDQYEWYYSGEGEF